MNVVAGLAGILFQRFSNYEKNVCPTDSGAIPRGTKDRQSHHHHAEYRDSSRVLLRLWWRFSERPILHWLFFAVNLAMPVVVVAAIVFLEDFSYFRATR